MSNAIRCPECASTDVECSEKPRHTHRCFSCGYSTPPDDASGASAAERLNEKTGDAPLTTNSEKEGDR